VPQEKSDFKKVYQVEDKVLLLNDSAYTTFAQEGLAQISSTEFKGKTDLNSTSILNQTERARLYCKENLAAFHSGRAKITQTWKLVAKGDESIEVKDIVTVHHPEDIP
jgi:hypothetical protein